jgi:hypothetical protein
MCDTNRISFGATTIFDENHFFRHRDYVPIDQYSDLSDDMENDNDQDGLSGYSPTPSGNDDDYVAPLPPPPRHHVLPDHVPSGPHTCQAGPTCTQRTVHSSHR